MPLDTCGHFRGTPSMTAGEQVNSTQKGDIQAMEIMGGASWDDEPL